MKNIKDYDLEDLKEELISYDEKPYRAEQIFKWIYQENITSFDDMTNLSLELRQKLKDNFTLCTYNIIKKQESKKDETKHIISGIINDFNKDKQIQYVSNIKMNNSFTNKYLGRILFKWPKINDKYIYNGPFYCEQASNGDYTSTDCNIVLENEYLAVMNSDIFIAVFGESFSVGTIVELDWALDNKKEIIILYCEESSNYTIKSEYWFAIANALKKKKDIRIYTYKEKKELNNVLRDVLYG